MNDESILTSLLDSLTTPTGELDWRARRKALDNLVHSLSQPEIFRLRCQLSDIPTTSDPCVALPNEVLLCIIDYLDLEDFLTARSVSRKWRESWSDCSVSMQMIKVHFPSVLQSSYKSLDEENQVTAKQNLSKWLPDAARNRIKREQGRYNLRWTDLINYNNNDIPIPNDSNSRHQYKNGKVACRLDSTRIAVKSLLTSKSTIYLDEDRQTISMWKLSDQFLVGELGARNRLRAWSLETDYSVTIRLPSIPICISVHRNLVGIQFKSTFLIWRIGQSVQTFQHPSLEALYSRPLPIIFHPDDNDIFFVTQCSLVVRGELRKADKMRLTAVEYLHGEQKQSYHMEMQTPEDMEERRDEKSDYYPQCLFLGDDGICNFVWGDLLGDRKLTAEFVHQYQWPENSTAIPSLRRVFTILTFDTYSKAFSVRYHYQPGSERFQPISHLHIWRNQILYPSVENNVENDIEVAGLRWDIQANALCGKTPHQAPFTYWYQGTGPKYSVRRRQPRDERGSVAYLWMSEPSESNYSEENSGNADYLVRGDDDFVVRFRDSRFIVWCFLTPQELEKRCQDESNFISSK